MEDIEKIIKHTNTKNQEKVDWTKAWSKKYPVLATYKDEVDVEKYAKEIRKLLESLQQEYQYQGLYRACGSTGRAADGHAGIPEGRYSKHNCRTGKERCRTGTDGSRGCTDKSRTGTSPGAGNS